ncbi:MAG TPA: hypothetical protein VL096_13465 [Pirellulaceae bacterium]|nr:hypothetical protein [Pirellulaceae bacterium]
MKQLANETALQPSSEDQLPAWQSLLEFCQRNTVAAPLGWQMPEGIPMGEQQEEPDQQATNLENEIREERKFTLAEAIGRLAGPGMMKGVSPATRKQQADAAIESFLEQHLISPAGALNAVLLRQVRESEMLLRNLDQPLVAILAYIQQVLNSDHLLLDLVRQADCEWGRLYDERPYFEQPGAKSHKDDPYTRESVQISLRQLAEKLSTPDRLAP